MRLDPLGNRDESEGMREVDEVGGNRRVLGVVGGTLNKRVVDLDHVDREMAELTQRGETGAEVVDRDPNALLVEQLQLCPRAISGEALFDDRRLGHLESERAWRKRRFFECLSDDRVKAA